MPTIVWDLYPLGADPLNDVVTDEPVRRGEIVSLGYKRPRRTWPSGEVIEWIPDSRRFYVPTESDLEFIRERYNCDSPPWGQIEADLTVSGKDAATLHKSRAPVLLGMLRQSQKPDGERASSEPKAVTQENSNEKKRRGAPITSDPEQDRRIDEAVKSLGSRAEAARQFNISDDQVLAAQDRHRKRNKSRQAE